jgi:hydroxyacylglutathione hydrolase
VIVEHLTVGPLACTCTIVADPESGTAIVVDGGDEAERIAARLDALGVRATHLVHTHAHIDHIGSVGELRERTNARALLHPNDLPLYHELALQARWLDMTAPNVEKLDGDLRDGDTLAFGGSALHVHHTPGHTPGSVCFSLENDGKTTILSGDTLFRGAIGRWDLGGTSAEDIVDSIREKLLAFADDTVVIPGHGPKTTIGEERAGNPFLV